MSQFGAIQQTDLFKRLQAADVRSPTYSVYLDSFGDVTKDVKSIEVSAKIEDSLHEPNFGHGTVVLSNEGAKYTSAGMPLIEPHYNIKIFAGFEGMNIPIWGGMVVDPVVDTGMHQISLSVAQYGWKLRRMQTSGDFADYDSPKLFINYLCTDAGINTPIYENEAGVPTDFTFGSTFMEDTRTYWAFIHGSTLCMFYVPYFDVNGRLNCVRRSSFTDVGFTFDDSNIKSIAYEDDADLINRKVIDFGTSIKFQDMWTFGDKIMPFQMTYSRTNKYSKNRWGEDADYETGPLIGNYQNAKSLTAEIMDWYPYKRVLYRITSIGVPQLEIFDRVRVYSKKHGIEGRFIIIGRHHSMTPGRYTTTDLLMSAGERL